jgi:hypothetical protein
VAPSDDPAAASKAQARSVKLEAHDEACQPIPGTTRNEQQRNCSAIFFEKFKDGGSNLLHSRVAVRLLFF